MMMSWIRLCQPKNNTKKNGNYEANFILCIYIQKSNAMTAISIKIKNYDIHDDNDDYNQIIFAQ